jgi:hypothetical protein
VIVVFRMEQCFIIGARWRMKERTTRLHVSIRLAKHALNNNCMFFIYHF